MADRQSPTVRRRRLGIELRRWREAAGKTIEEVADLLECSASKVSRIETGRVPVRARDVRDMLEMYRVPHDQVDVLLALSRESRQRGWWHDYNDVLPGWFQVFIGLEAEASALWTYDAHYVIGLLQTEAYYREVIRSSLLEPGKDEVDQLVTLRMSRQAQLIREENPPRLWVVQDEAVLRRAVGGPVVMAEQLRRLVEAAASPAVTLQVIPFATGAHAAMPGPFCVFGFPDPSDPKVVYLEYLTGSIYLEKVEDIDRYTLAFDHLRASALSPKDSVELIGTIAREYEESQ